METTLISHRESFEILPAIAVTRMRRCWIVDLSWGTVTLDIQINRKTKE